MAIKKQIMLDNGITTNYHRIVSINKITNNSTIIEVASYINEEQRLKEKNNISSNIYIHTSYENVVYDESKTITDYYNLLQALEKYKDSEII